jgi:hypothetical protein
VLVPSLDLDFQRHMSWSLLFCSVRMDDTWNVQGDEWGNDNWRDDVPSWEGETGPLVGGTSFGVPIQAAPVI